MKLNELPPATQPLNKTLKSIGLTKDQIAKMLITKVIQAVKVLAIIAIAFAAVLCLIVLALAGIIMVGELSQ